MENSSNVICSIIIPAYNCAKYIKQALDSITIQELQNIEVIIIDDGSTDETFAIAKDYATRDARFRVYTQINSGGPAQPRNLGIEKSLGKYICFLDPDDYWLPDKLKRQLLILEQYPDVALAFSDINLVDSTGVSFGNTYLSRVNYLNKAQPYLNEIGNNLYLSTEGFYAFSSVEILGIQTSGVIVRRSVIESIKPWFPLDLSVGEDSDFWYRIIELFPVIFINETLYAYRQHNDSLMHNSEKVVKGSLFLHHRNYQRCYPYLNDFQIKNYRRRIAGHYVDLAYFYWVRFDFAHCRKTLVKSLSWNFTAKTLIAIIKTFLPKKIVRILKSVS